MKISEQATQNMSCAAGVCTATAAKAVLNIGDLTNLLAAGDATVKTGSLAKDIVVKAALSWTSASRLTLDAQQTVEIAKPVTVAGDGALTITTDDGGQNGEFLIDPKQSVQFWNLSSSLIIGGNSYTLVGDIKTLAADIAGNPSGFYALAKPYDASADGTYASSAIGTTFTGWFEGLGNAVSNYRLNFRGGNTPFFGFFGQIASSGVVRDFALLDTEISGIGDAFVGTLAADNEGKIISCRMSGELSKTDPTTGVGGLVDVNGGSITKSSAKVTIQVDKGKYVGGLVAYNAGTVSRSYSEGRVLDAQSLDDSVGGLVGLNEAGDGQLLNVFSTASVRGGTNACCNLGGLIGENGGIVRSAYAAGKIGNSRNGRAVFGGVVGDDEAAPKSIKAGYWDLDKGISNPSQGAGNIPNDPGIEGLTTAQLQSGLPQGFDPKIWAQQPGKNGGFPYLIGTTAE
ncbi:MAG TPA: hypothetical protein VLC74_10525 [Rhizomicrobium sp.]|nr:hypothetical protein [Rhizomicrobium sp.]